MISGLKDRMLNISSSAKRNILWAGAAVLTIAILLTLSFTFVKRVTVIDGGNPEKTVITLNRYVDDFLKAQGITLGSKDKLSLDYDSALKNNMEIRIYRAFPIIVTEKGVSREETVTRRTVGAALTELGLRPKRTDKMTPAYDALLEDFSEVTFVRVEERTEKTVEEIPYEATERENKALASGTRKLVQRGVPGEKTVSYKVIYEDGVEVSKTMVSEEVTKEPIAQIREVGARRAVTPTVAYTGGTVKTSRSGNLAVSHVLTVNATAYDASSCGKSPSHPAYGITATGARAGYGIVAVDPRVIPLGSKLYIESADGSYVYGNAVAADTGGAIKGNRIDLCFNTRAEAVQFGRRNLKVYVLK